jgi:FtsH-binding integral membrane protein
MSSEFDNWNQLAKLWHAHTTSVPASEVHRSACRQSHHMFLLAAAEAVCMVLAYVAAVWIAVQAAMVSLTAIVSVFVGVCAFLHHRLRREPSPDGGHDLLSSLEHSIAREEWNLSQFAVGRVVTWVTLAGMLMLSSDHLRAYATTPAARLWAMLAIVALLLVTLAVNIALTRKARTRKRHMEDMARRMRAGPEFRDWQEAA